MKISFLLAYIYALAYSLSSELFSSLLIFVRKTILTIYFWIIVSIGTLSALIHIFAPALEKFDSTIVDRILDHDNITKCIENNMARFIYDNMVNSKIWNVEFFDKRSEDAKKTAKNYILAANHASLIDTLFVALLPFRKTYSYNAKWSYVPVFGWLSYAAGYISISKSSPESLRKIVPEVIRRVKMGYSFMIYPEGSRSNKPQTVPYDIKTGAFRVSQGSNVPILPVVFVNTHKAVSMYGVVDFANIKIYLLEPIQVQLSSESEVNANAINIHNSMKEYTDKINEVLQEHY